MNSKKGKKKSKPHPTPIVVSNIEEKKEIHDEVIQHEDTAVKECTLETIEKVVLAEVKSEDAAPKKPKRNRGKNKKQDKEEELSEEHKQSEVEKDVCDTFTPADLVSVSNLDFKTDDKDNLDSSNNACVECETVTPTTRKKKNKKKDNKTNVENLSESQLTLPLKENEPSKIEEYITESLRLSETENLMKPNKKNKKKKRHDSGASDKVEEILCATAFQQSTKGINEKSTSVLAQDSLQKENILVEVPNTTDYFLKISETDNAQEVLQKSNEGIDIFREETILTEEFSKHEIQGSALLSKENNKKSNKKDIQQRIEASFDDNKGQEQILKLPPIEKEDSKNLVEETLKDSLATSIESTLPDLRDTDIKEIHKSNESAGSPIVKAIIAKPVEKKKKGKKDRHEVENKKLDIFDSENDTNKASQEANITEKSNIINVDNSESKGYTVPQDIKSEDCQHVNEDLILSQEFEVIKIPDNAMGKKRKKSPKIPRVVIPVPAALEEKILNITKGDKQAPETAITIPIDSEKAVIETQTEIVSQIEPNIDSPDVSKNAPELKSRRKGKKSQKAPLTPGVTDFIPTFDTESKTPFVEFEAHLSEKTEEYKALSPEVTTYNISEPLLESSTVGHENKYDEKDITDIPFIDTEINLNISTLPSTLKREEQSTELKESSIVTDSCKTEVETPTLDIIPDIHYPRSSSQGYDGNNNTVIQEIRPDELQLPSVKDSPVIQGSGETPIGTPKMIISDIVISEVPETENLMEKTDLKSKMLEVNRDMEELRMSIERSLAEFTALETSEERIEKEYEDKMKIDTEERDISKNNTKKSDVEINEEINQSPMTSELITDDANKTKVITLSKLHKQPSYKEEDTETIQSVKEFSEKININETVNKCEGDTEKNTEAVLSVSRKNIEQKTEHVDKKQDIKCSDPNQPIHPSKKDNKGKNKKRKGKQEAAQSVQSSQSTSEIKNETKENSNKKEEKCETTEQSTSNSQEKSKQQADTELFETKQESPNIDNKFVDSTTAINIDFEAIENFEDALTSSTEDADINKSFDMIVNETNVEIQQKLAANKPEIKIIGPDEKPKEKVTPPKNLLGHPDIPVPSNRTDYKKEKNRTPNTKQAKVKIKDSVEVELPEKYKTDKEETELPETVNNELQKQKSVVDIFDNQIKDPVTYSKSQNDIKENGQHQHAEEPETVLTKNDPSKSFTVEPHDGINANKKVIKTENAEKRKQSTQSQTENRRSKKNKDSLTQLKENEEFVYKYSFRKVFLQNACNVCKKELKLRVACNFCNLLFYCSNKHKDEDWPQHQALCFAISTIGHMKDQKYIYADTKNITGQNYRLVRMQMILSCEKVLKRRLVPWEQELLLYPRICAEASCRQWKQTKLKDCEGCGQISYCVDKPEHLPKTHQRWCKSYSLYQKLVIHQQTKGRLEPKMPTKVMAEPYQIPDKINEMLASIYEEKIDMNDVQYAALTQLATAPLTAAYAHQVYANKVNPTTNGITKKPIFTIHVVGAELQFEADALNKWEVFFLHLRPDVQELKVVLISTDLNPSNLPLDLLAKIKHCENCRTNKRRVTFSFQDKKKYAEYRSSKDYCYPDLICAFNPSIQRSSVYKDLDTWPSTLNTVLRTKVPFTITAYSIAELLRDLIRVKECVDIDYKVISEAKYNSFASVRPDRNFITDDEMPLLFKNYCFMIICGC
ncbi:hypothetical protein K1T71_012419 [Dendrolimus kikuchii]|uniref:Uncharacterized protein n=1 Tax=Dendrolimus kikuchii TaxID=765133 RepID=A0ACC1CJB7_9NEOP|nr:hypothetical protein K1T71_012419 [Dendrolimus kikuchii]